MSSPCPLRPASGMSLTVTSLWVPRHPAHISASGPFIEWVCISCQDADRDLRLESGSCLVHLWTPLIWLQSLALEPSVNRYRSLILQESTQFEGILPTPPSHSSLSLLRWLSSWASLSQGAWAPQDMKCSHIHGLGCWSEDAVPLYFPARSPGLEFLEMTSILRGSRRGRWRKLWSGRRKTFPSLPFPSNLACATCWDEYWVLYGNQFDNKSHILKNKKKNKVIWREKNKKTLIGLPLQDPFPNS